MNKSIQILFLLLFTFSMLAVAQGQMEADLVGTWSGQNNLGAVYLVLSPDGQYAFNYLLNNGTSTGTAGTYKISGNTINFHIYPNGERQTATFQVISEGTMVFRVGNEQYQLMRISQPELEKGGIFGGNNTATPPKRVPKTYQGDQNTKPGDNTTKPNPNNNQVGAFGIPEGKNPASVYYQPQAQADSAQNFTSHQHPAGFSYSAPADWQKTQQQQKLDVFVPADSHKVGNQPAEGAMVYADRINGMTDLMGTQFKEYIVGEVNKLLPYLQLKGRQQTAHGVVFFFEGMNNIGLTIRGHLYMKNQGDKRLTVFGLCPTPAMQRRDYAFYTMHVTSTLKDGGQAGQ